MSNQRKPYKALWYYGKYSSTAFSNVITLHFTHNTCNGYYLEQREGIKCSLQSYTIYLMIYRSLQPKCEAMGCQPDHPSSHPGAHINISNYNLRTNHGKTIVKRKEFDSEAEWQRGLALTYSCRHYRKSLIYLNEGVLNRNP